MRYELLFPSDYLKAVEFLGKDVTVTIAGVKMETLKMQGGRSEDKPVVSFKETKKKLVLNKTNAKSIAALYGPETDDWTGKKVTLFPARVGFGNDTVDAIRVREKVGK